MVISRTPLRVSFVGGGTDLPSFASRHGGAVVSTAIDKYVYVVITERFEPSIRVSYSKTEIVDRVDDIRHELVREALRAAGVPRKVEILTIADVPSRGTGLGSSSAVTVGVLNALFAYQGILKSSGELAEEAARIEIERLRKPIGKQDHYACAFGGMQLLQFHADGTVTRDPVVMNAQRRRNLERNLMMFYTGGQRAADDVLGELKSAISNVHDVEHQLEMMRDLAHTVYDDLGTGDDLDAFGRALHQNWELKRSLTSGITTPEIDAWYDRAIEAGAIGGKVLGAGGAGFLLFYVPRGRQEAVRDALGSLRELPFRFETSGSRIIHIGR